MHQFQYSPKSSISDFTWTKTNMESPHPSQENAVNHKSKKYELANRQNLLIYKIILKPIWTYGIELWGCSKPSNTEVLQTFQSKMLRSITKAPWFASNQTLHADLGISFINDVINKEAIKQRSHRGPR
jgi:hypothetical protein